MSNFAERIAGGYSLTVQARLASVAAENGDLTYGREHWVHQETPALVRAALTAERHLGPLCIGAFPGTYYTESVPTIPGDSTTTVTSY